MSGGRSIDSVDEEIATAFGLLALTDAEIQAAATEAGVTQWELEEAIQNAGVAEMVDLDEQKEASDTLDELFENDQ